MRQHRSTSPPEGESQTRGTALDELDEVRASVRLTDARLERACRIGGLLAGHEAQAARLLANGHPNAAQLHAALDRLSARTGELLETLSLLLTEARAEVARAIPHLEAGYAAARTDHWTVVHLAEPVAALAEVA